MSDWILQLNSLWVWVLVALLLVMLFVLVVLSTVVRRSRTPQAAAVRAPAEPVPATAAHAPEEPTDALPPEAPAASFSRAMRFLRSTVSGRDYRYQIPWYLMLGDRGSGKNALMRSVGINLAAAEQGSRSPLKWRFLDSGILIGVSGRYCRGTGREDQDWNHMLRLLQNNRPRRPLDGIVITVAASDLTGALDENQVSARAARLSEMLGQAQRTLGFVFPVYVIVTKCDEIDGFSAFCRELPSRNREDVFGWSSPYQLDASFAPEWVDEAFNSVSGDLQRLQSEILVERSELRDPDAVFLFPEEFARLRPTLGIYLERLFRETAYREAFRFRGLYFCGDISEPIIAEQPAESVEQTPIEELLPEIMPPQAQQMVAALPKSPSFTRRLFEEKIFPESGLGRPLASVFLTKSRTVTYIQTAAAILGIVLVAGTWFSYRRLEGDRDRMIPPLDRMTSSTLRANTPEEAKTFGLGLLNGLDLAANVRFFSVFQPASWFSPLDENVTLVMKIACEQWVFSSFQAELVQRKNKLLYPQAAPPAAPSGDGNGVDTANAQDQNADVVTGSIDSVPEYQVLLRYVGELQSLEEAITTYEDLRQQGQTTTPDRIRKLLSYLGLSDVRPSGHLAAALVSASGPSAGVSNTDIATASDTIRKLTGDILRNWFDNNQAWDDVERLQQAISTLQHGQGSAFDKLEALVAQVNQVQSDFTDPNFRWLANTGMDLPPALKRTSVNPLSTAQNVELAAYANGLGGGYLVSLRDNLRDARSSLTGGPLLDLKNPIDLSPGTKQLQMALDNLLNLPFMSGAMNLPLASASADSETIQTALKTNQRLIWRLDPLLEAQKQTKFYTDFISNGMGNAPQTTPALVSTLSPIALNQLSHQVRISIAKAETFQPRTTMGGGTTDDETLEEVNAFRDAIGPLEQLADQYNGFGKTDIRNAVLQITLKQSYALLSTLDEHMSREQPYAAKPGAWTGAGSFSFAIFGVNSAQAMQVYLGAQRERVKYFEQQAEALVPFLARYMPVQAVEQKQLITKWQGIITDFQQYANKGTNSTISELEDYISTGIDKLPASACKSGTPEGGTDYFVQIHNHLSNQLSSRCGDVTANGVCTAYAALAAEFNVKLAGKYPFATSAAIKTEADPLEIAAFYKALDAGGKAGETGLKASLDNADRFGEDGRKARHFLDQVDDLRTIAVPSGDNAKEPPFTLDVVPQFRVNRTREVGGNQVIDWTMQVVGQIFQLKDPEHPGRWRPSNPDSNPVRLSLRWANDSVYVPAPDSGQPDMVIRDRNAYFEFTDRWALLRFLQRHEAPPGDLGPNSDSSPYTLKFRVQTVQDPKWTGEGGQPNPGPATVYLHMKVLVPGEKTGIRIPPVPASAPVLTTGCASM